MYLHPYLPLVIRIVLSVKFGVTLAAAAAAMSAKVFLKRKKDDEIDELEKQITTSTSSLPSQVIPQVNVSR